MRIRAIALTIAIPGVVIGLLGLGLSLPVRTWRLAASRFRRSSLILATRSCPVLAECESIPILRVAPSQKQILTTA